jgi:membrane protein
MAVLLHYLKVHLPWREIVRRTFHEAFFKDNCLAMAAQLAYYFFFALFPTLLFVVALASYFPVANLIDDLFRTLGGFMPPEALQIITEQITKISGSKDTSLLSLGMLLALSSSSSAMIAIIDTLNRAYDVEDGRSWWKVRLSAMGLTVAVAIFILVSFALVIVGPTLATKLADWMHLGPVFEWTWKILQWPLIFALVSTAIALIYYFAPDVEQDWVWLTPGSIVATTLWLLASLGFKYYVANWGNYTETYGLIGAVMILLLWFYISGLVILLGAELNAVVEHASPHGKDPGEKVPGQKRKIGPAAMRAWIARRRARGGKPPSVEEVKHAPEIGVAETTPPAALPAAPALSTSSATAFVSTASVASPQPGVSLSLSDWAVGAGFLGALVWWASRTPSRNQI